MYTSMIATTLLCASAAFAAPYKVRPSNETFSSSGDDSDVRVADSDVRAADSDVIVALSSSTTGSQTTFTGLAREVKAPVGGSALFDTLEVIVGAGNPNQDLRCQALDLEGNPIIATRGANTDITFADGGNPNPWSFQQPSEVSKIICDPAFEAVGADAFEVRVALQNQGIEFGVQVVFDSVVEREVLPSRTGGNVIETVELFVGELAQQNLRCQIVDRSGEPLVVLRGGNRDITFADGDAGLWNLEVASEVSHIICDPEFVIGSSA